MSDRTGSTVPPPRVIVGVAGGSGSGKTTVVRRIVDSLGPEEVTVLDHDRYYRDRNDLRLEERAALNYDHPDALETDLMVRARARAEGGRAGRRCRSYDFTRHARLAETDTLHAAPGADRRGHPGLHRPGACGDLMDIKVFVDTDSDTRFIRRLRRDVADRGRTMDSVIEQYQGTVKPMHLEFVEPSKRYADVIIPLGGHNAVAVDLLLTLLRSVVGATAVR